MPKSITSCKGKQLKCTVFNYLFNYELNINNCRCYDERIWVKLRTETHTHKCDN